MALNRVIFLLEWKDFAQANYFYFHFTTLISELIFSNKLCNFKIKYYTYSIVNGTLKDIISMYLKLILQICTMYR